MSWHGSSGRSSLRPPLVVDPFRSPAFTQQAILQVVYLLARLVYEGVSHGTNCTHTGGGHPHHISGASPRGRRSRNCSHGFLPQQDGQREACPEKIAMSNGGRFTGSLGTRRRFSDR